MSRLVVTEGATYEQRSAGVSNNGAPLTEVATVAFHPLELAYAQVTPWALLDPSQAEPYVGDRWLLRHTHGKYVLTDVVNEIVGDLT